MLRTLPEDEKSRWKDSINKVVHAYNCTVNEETGFSPFYLLFGRSPRLPVDLLFGTPTSVTNESHTEYVKRWKDAMKDAYTKANNNSNKAANAEKEFTIAKIVILNCEQATVYWFDIYVSMEVLESCDLIGVLNT